MKSPATTLVTNLFGRVSFPRFAAKSFSPIGFLLYSFGVAIIGGAPSPAHATPVSVTVDSGLEQRADATVTIKDSSGRVVRTGTTAVPSKGGSPKFTTDSPPGTYTIEASWRNGQTRTESGTMTYTVTAGKNEPNVAVAEGGYRNPPGSGTSAIANGITVTGQAPVGQIRPHRQFDPDGAYGSISGIPIMRPRVSLSSLYDSHNTEAVNLIPLFTGGNDNGGSLIKEDANTSGFLNEFKIGVGGNNNFAGADGFYTNLGFRYGWGMEKTSIDQLVVPAGQTGDVPGIGVLNNVAINQADDISIKSEFESYTFFAGVGLRYDIGPVGNYPIGNIGNVGDLRDERGLVFAPNFEIFGGFDNQSYTTRFFNAGAPNVIMEDLDIYRVGGRFRSKFHVPITQRLKFTFAPELAITHNDTKAKFSQLQNVSTGEEKVNDSNFSFTTGFTTSLNYKLTKDWSIALEGSLQNEFDRPAPQVTRSNSESSSVREVDDLHYSVGMRLTFSDRRLKTNVVRIGTLPSGLPVYRFNYIWSDDTYVGVIAQEAQEFFPEAVQEIDGYLAVDYSRIR